MDLMIVSFEYFRLYWVKEGYIVGKVPKITLEVGMQLISNEL
jgi:hypothetical protein